MKKRVIIGVMLFLFHVCFGIAAAEINVLGGLSQEKSAEPGETYENEIIIINSHPDSILKFIDLTEEIRETQRTRWKEKIEKWKQNIDCDYDWDCADCPYEETCDEVKEVLDEREKIEE